MQQFKIPITLAYILMIALTVTACSTISKKASAQSQSKNIIKNFPRPTGYVSDFAFLYSSIETDSLENIIGNFEKSTTIQFALITLKASMVEKDSLEVFTEAIGNAWGVGQKEPHNGVVIGICPEYRKMTIRNGFGIEKIMSDAETKEIIDKYFIPGFKESKYFEGTIKGLQALIEILTKKLNTKKGVGKIKPPTLYYSSVKS